VGEAEEDITAEGKDRDRSEETSSRWHYCCRTETSVRDDEESVGGAEEAGEDGVSETGTPKIKN
jgi:hypothetical protein